MLLKKKKTLSHKQQNHNNQSSKLQVQAQHRYILWECVSNVKPSSKLKLSASNLRLRRTSVQTKKNQTKQNKILQRLMGGKKVGLAIERRSGIYTKSVIKRNEEAESLMFTNHIACLRTIL